MKEGGVIGKKREGGGYRGGELEDGKGRVVDTYSHRAQEKEGGVIGKGSHKTLTLGIFTKAKNSLPQNSNLLFNIQIKFTV